MDTQAAPAPPAAVAAAAGTGSSNGTTAPSAAAEASAGASGAPVTSGRKRFACWRNKKGKDGNVDSGVEASGSSPAEAGTTAAGASTSATAAAGATAPRPGPGAFADPNAALANVDWDPAPVYLGQDPQHAAGSASSAAPGPAATGAASGSAGTSERRRSRDRRSRDRPTRLQEGAPAPSALLASPAQAPAAVGSGPQPPAGPQPQPRPPRTPAVPVGGRRQGRQPMSDANAADATAKGAPAQQAQQGRRRSRGRGRSSGDQNMQSAAGGDSVPGCAPLLQSASPAGNIGVKLAQWAEARTAGVGGPPPGTSNAGGRGRSRDSGREAAQQAQQAQRAGLESGPQVPGGGGSGAGRSRRQRQQPQQPQQAPQSGGSTPGAGGQSWFAAAGSDQQGARRGRSARGLQGRGSHDNPSSRLPPSPVPGILSPAQMAQQAQQGAPPSHDTMVPLPAALMALSITIGQRTPGSSGRSRSRSKQGNCKPYMSAEELQCGLKLGWLFRVKFRVNATDRSQAFASIPGLKTDAMVRGAKCQNRAIEGDEVAIRILPPAQWYTIRSGTTAPAPDGDILDAAAATVAPTSPSPAPGGTSSPFAAALSQAGGTALGRAPSASGSQLSGGSSSVGQPSSVQVRAGSFESLEGPTLTATASGLSVAGSVTSGQTPAPKSLLGGAALTAAQSPPANAADAVAAASAVINRLNRAAPALTAQAGRPDPNGGSPGLRGSTAALAGSFDDLRISDDPLELEAAPFARNRSLSPSRSPSRSPSLDPALSSSLNSALSGSLGFSRPSTPANTLGGPLGSGPHFGAAPREPPSPAQAALRPVKVATPVDQVPSGQSPAATGSQQDPFMLVLAQGSPSARSGDTASRFAPSASHVAAASTVLASPAAPTAQPIKESSSGAEAMAAWQDKAAESAAPIPSATPFSRQAAEPLPEARSATAPPSVPSAPPPQPVAAASATKQADPLQQRPWEDCKCVADAVAQIAASLEGHPELRPTAEVVSILAPSPRRNAVVGVLREEPAGNLLFLMPCDPRLPKMVVRSATLPAEIKQAIKAEAKAEAGSIAKTLVSGIMTGWDANQMFPSAEVRASLGQAGDIETETKAILAMESVSEADFTEEVLGCLPTTPWSISNEELAKRKDLRGSRIFSIDPPTARDLDDALSVEPLPNGNLRVGVHIADVAHFIGPGSALDLEAQERGTSVYLVQKVIPMLPRLLCEQLCSLNPGVDRLSFSIVWELTPEGQIVDQWAGRSVICSCAKLSYDHAQQMIEGTFTPTDDLNVELYGDHSWEQVIGDVLSLHSVARNLRHQRYENGALRLDNVKLGFTLDEEGNPSSAAPYIQRESNQLVEEFMLLANMSVARLIARAFPDRAILRRHPPPNERKMAELEAVAGQLDLGIDCSSAGALQASLTALRQAALDSTMLDVVQLLATKPMQVALYFCTGELEDEHEWRHYALAVPHYTHFTSPIRRYPDVMVHRLLAAALEQQARGGDRAAPSEPGRGAGRLLASALGSTGQPGAAGASRPDPKLCREHGLLECEAAAKVAQHCNDRKQAAKNVQDASLRLYLCVMLRLRPTFTEGVVLNLNGNRFFDVYLPEFGLDCRIHTDQMNGIEADWNAVTKTLSFVASPSPPATQPAGAEPTSAAATAAAVAPPTGTTTAAADGPAKASEPAASATGPATSAEGATTAADAVSQPSQALDTTAVAAALALPNWVLEGVPNADKMANPKGLQPLALPLQLRPFDRVPLLVSSRQFGNSGRPSEVFARLYIKA